MMKAFTRFLRDESGAVTVDSVVVLGGSVWMAAVVVGDISVATLDVGAKINQRLEYASILAEILDDYGPGTNVGGEDVGGAEEVDCVGNPGNDKCVGNAGENPNGGDDWGSGSNGMSDSNDNPGRGRGRGRD